MAVDRRSQSARPKAAQVVLPSGGGKQLGKGCMARSEGLCCHNDGRKGMPAPPLLSRSGSRRHRQCECLGPGENAGGEMRAGRWLERAEAFSNLGDRTPIAPGNTLGDDAGRPHHASHPVLVDLPLSTTTREQILRRGSLGRKRRLLKPVFDQDFPQRSIALQLCLAFVIKVPKLLVIGAKGYGCVICCF